MFDCLFTGGVVLHDTGLLCTDENLREILWATGRGKCVWCLCRQFVFYLLSIFISPCKQKFHCGL